MNYESLRSCSKNSAGGGMSASGTRAVHDDYDYQTAAGEQQPNNTSRESSRVCHAFTVSEEKLVPHDNKDLDQQDQQLPPLNGTQKLTIAMMAFVNFCALNCFSLIAPFFPSEAKRKGANETEVGFVFGSFELAICLASPVFGRYITRIGSKFMFIAGVVVCAGCCILFGFLNRSPDGTVFISMCFVVRIVEGIGTAAFVTASFAIIASEFPGRASTMFGLLETFTGLGLMTGPPIGGALYEIGGFVLPFITMGSILLVCAAVNVFILPQPSDQQKPADTNFLSLLRHPSIFVSALSVCVSALSVGLTETSLELHLQQFSLSPFYVGLMFISLAGTYAFIAPFWGWLADTKLKPKTMMLCGSIVLFVALNLIGPSPVLPFDSQLWLVGVSLALVSIGASAMFVPPFKDCLDEAKYHGFPESFDTYGLVSGLISSGFSFGAFFGPTVGGFMNQMVGFKASASYISLLSIIMLFILVVFKLRDHLRQRAYRRFYGVADGGGYIKSSIYVPPLESPESTTPQENGNLLSTDGHSSKEGWHAGYGGCSSGPSHYIKPADTSQGQY